VRARDQLITLIPDQSFVSVGGRIDSLSAPVQRDRGGYLVPIDFLSRAVARALGQRIDVRRDSRIIVVGNVRVPRVTMGFEQSNGAGRLRIDIEPATPHRVAREGNRLTVQFDAVALDLVPLRDADASFVAGTRVADATLEVELGPSVSSFRVESATDDTSVTLDLLPPAPATPPTTPPAAPTPPSPPPVLDLGSPGLLRTVVIDPGHGGTDTGVRGPGGTLEKDITLQVARRLKSTIESRLGLRVLLTREGDLDIPIDRRMALANNNKADLYISLHANASTDPARAGAQILTLDLEAYRDRAGAPGGPGTALPLIGGGTRLIEAVPWDLAQLPFADRSMAVGTALIRQLAQRGVPLYVRPAIAAPLRGLVGANMPAVHLEMGFLSNPTEERAMANADRSDALIEAIVGTIAGLRGVSASDDRGRGAR
jgi:N-acetylmuramoyl-L-alanine amidase